MSSSPLYIVESKKSVADAVKSLNEVVPKHNFSVMQAHDLKAKLTAKGAQCNHDVQVIEVCNPQHASAALKEDRSVSSVLPCRISVYEEGGKTKMCTVLPSSMVTMFAHPDKLQPMMLQVEETLKKIMNEAA